MDEVAAGGSFAGYTDLDLEFHHRIAEIAGNPIVSKLLENVRTVMQHQLAAINTTREILGTSMEIHRKICAAIERGESEAARSAMEEHIDIIEEKYRAYACGIPAEPAGSSGLKVKA
jgi:DNA-binding FadR family transcriptional regulator